MVLLQAKDGLHDLGVAAGQQLREDVALFIRVVFACRDREVMKDLRRQLARLRIRSVGLESRNQGRQLAEREYGLPMADIEHVEAVAHGSGTGSTGRGGGRAHDGSHPKRDRYRTDFRDRERGAA